jgi:hypothetical protein
MQTTPAIPVPLKAILLVTTKNGLRTVGPVTEEKARGYQASKIILLKDRRRATPEDLRDASRMRCHLVSHKDEDIFWSDELIGKL